MKQLIGWSLMGLRKQGHFDTWVMLRTFTSAELAQAAAADPTLVGSDILQTRVMPYYRVAHPEHAQPSRPRILPLLENGASKAADFVGTVA